MHKIFLANPFTILGLSFPIVCCVYLLSWSELYPILSCELLSFICLTSAFSLIIGLLLHYNNVFYYKNVKSFSYKKIQTYVIWLYLGIFLECVAVMKIPILSAFIGESSDYTNFGVPYLHLLVTSFSGFLSLYILHCLLSVKDKYVKKKLFSLYLLVLLSPLIYYNRGCVMMSIFSSIILCIMHSNRILNALKLIVPIFLIITFVFGVLGNIRIGDETRGEYITSLGKSSSIFDKSIVPSEYFWTYLYVSSPLANLQYNIDSSFGGGISIANLNKVFVDCCVPAIVGNQIKRLGGDFEQADNTLIIDQLNVTTYYCSAYNYMGYYGMIFLFLFTLFFIIITFLIIPSSSPFFTISIAIVDTVLVFNTFTNMLVFNALIFQLFIPISFHLYQLSKKVLCINKAKYMNMQKTTFI